MDWSDFMEVLATIFFVIIVCIGGGAALIAYRLAF